MSNTLTHAMESGTTVPLQAPPPGLPQRVERRRPGRIENASPELIALMRKPASTTNRVKVALYDAPGFLLPDTVRPPRPGRAKAVLLAIAGSSAGWALVFNLMMWAWG